MTECTIGRIEDLAYELNGYLAEWQEYTEDLLDARVLNEGEIESLREEKALAHERAIACMDDLRAYLPQL